MKVQNIAFISFFAVTVLSIVLFLTVSTSQGQSCQVIKFKNWIRNNNKKYIDQKQYQEKFTTFSLSEKVIKDHNRYYEKGLSGFKMGLNKFSDMELQQFSTQFFDSCDHEKQLAQLRQLCAIEILTQQSKGKIQQKMKGRLLQQQFPYLLQIPLSQQNLTKVGKVHSIIKSTDKQNQVALDVESQNKKQLKPKFKSKNQIDAKLIASKPKRHTSVDALLSAIDQLYQRPKLITNQQNNCKDQTDNTNKAYFINSIEKEINKQNNSPRVIGKSYSLRQKQQKQQIKKDFIKLFSLKTVSDDKIQQSKNYLQNLAKNYGILIKRGTSIIESIIQKQDENLIQIEKKKNINQTSQRSQAQIKIKGCKVIQIPYIQNSYFQQSLQEIVRKNPILITLDLNEQTKSVLKFYKQGVINLNPSKSLDQKPNFLQEQKNKLMIHGQTNKTQGITFVIVGYSNDQKDSYWDVKSVWNKGWGQNGHLKIRKHRDLRQFKNVILSYPSF